MGDSVEQNFLNDKIGDVLRMVLSVALQSHINSKILFYGWRYRQVFASLAQVMKTRETKP
jgi:hypothetical protein